MGTHMFTIPGALISSCRFKFPSGIIFFGLLRDILPLTFLAVKVCCYKIFVLVCPTKSKKYLFWLRHREMVLLSKTCYAESLSLDALKVLIQFLPACITSVTKSAVILCCSLSCVFSVIAFKIFLLITDC